MEPRTLDGELQDLDGGVQGERVIERALRGHCIVLCIKRLGVYLLGYSVNPLNPELHPICYLLALLGAHHFLHVSRIRVKSLTFRRLMSYIYTECNRRKGQNFGRVFLMLKYTDITQNTYEVCTKSSCTEFFSADVATL